MIGGPFVDFEEQRLLEMRELIEDTKNNCKTLIALHGALKELDRLLQKEAKGASLEALYERVLLY